ncbi:MAG TPA: hypothetical protein V6C76_06550 [Drouetiella sp.]
MRNIDESTLTDESVVPKGQLLHQEIVIATGSKEAGIKMMREIWPDFDDMVKKDVADMRARGKTDATDEDSIKLTKMLNDGMLSFHLQQVINDDTVWYGKLIGTLKNAKEDGKPLSPDELKKEELYLISLDDHLPPAKFEADGSVTFPQLTSDDVLKEMQIVGAPKFDSQKAPALLPPAYVDAIKAAGEDTSKMSPADYKLESAINDRLRELVPVLNQMHVTDNNDPTLKEYYDLRYASMKLKDRETGRNLTR